MKRTGLSSNFAALGQCHGLFCTRSMWHTAAEDSAAVSSVQQASTAPEQSVPYSRKLPNLPAERSTALCSRELCD